MLSSSPRPALRAAAPSHPGPWRGARAGSAEREPGGGRGGVASPGVRGEARPAQLEDVNFLGRAPSGNRPGWRCHGQNRRCWDGTGCGAPRDTATSSSALSFFFFPPCLA